MKYYKTLTFQSLFFTKGASYFDKEVNDFLSAHPKAKLSGDLLIVVAPARDDPLSSMYHFAQRMEIN
jgi:hypothetical protein